MTRLRSSARKTHAINTNRLDARRPPINVRRSESGTLHHLVQFRTATTGLARNCLHNGVEDLATRAIEDLRHRRMWIRRPRARGESRVEIRFITWYNFARLLLVWLGIVYITA